MAVAVGMNWMSNRFERESERASEGRSSMSMMHLLGQMFLLPFTVFVYGMEMFVRTMRQVQTVADEGLDLTAGGGPTREDAQPGLGEFTNEPGLIVNAQATAQEVGGPDSKEPVAIATETLMPLRSQRPVGSDTESRELTKEREMDRDLRDDMLKLVRYKVLFVKREYEHAFREQEDLVSENMDGSAFTAWKVAEFIQGLAAKKTNVPTKWGKTYPEGYRTGDVLIGLPDEDKKYLRVYFEVMDRYPREKFKYEEEQISVLEDIRDELKKKRAAAPAPGNGGSPQSSAAFDEIGKRLEANKFRLKYQRQGFQLGHAKLSKDVSAAFTKFRKLGEFTALDIPAADLDKAFRDGVNTPFNPAGLDSFPGKWKGTNRHYDLAGKEIKEDASTWNMTWSKGTFSDNVYLQTVVGSKEKHYTADHLPELSEKKVDLALNLYRKELGITGWLSTFVEFRSEMALISYELRKGAFLWIGQILTEKLEPAQDEKLFWMFFEWKQNNKPNYFMYGLMFEIDFDEQSARHVEEQGFRKSRFDLIEGA
jgi:hypothetical protein